MRAELVEVVSRDDICGCGDGDGGEVGMFASSDHYFFEGAVLIVGRDFGEFIVKVFRECGGDCCCRSLRAMD